jgi:hypothetical protein
MTGDICGYVEVRASDANRPRMAVRCFRQL